jgi:hypothetical protein
MRVRFLNWLRDWNTSKTGRKEAPLSREKYEELRRNYDNDVAGLSKLLNKNLEEIWK